MSSVTTIRVSLELRDVLKRQARQRGATLGQHLQKLADAEENAIIMDKWAESVRACPPDAEYFEDVKYWESDSWN
ncbi:MAG: hypothetical protein Q4C71_05640 [Microbacteriaceae bacterium]|nr:hypothetical protein [Microbacteriaceae bacterium]